MSLESRPWALCPFELVHHGEIHHRRKTDYDRRLALISFDNSIEFSISAYLNLHPSQRGDRTYPGKKKQSWMRNFHSKLDFLETEIEARRLPMQVSRENFVWYHDLRNNHYHSGTPSVPSQIALDGVRLAALWVFAVLFDVSDPELEELLDSSIAREATISHSIPAGYAVPEKPAIDLKALAAASLVGQWDECNEADIEIIRRLIDGF